MKSYFRCIILCIIVLSLTLSNIHKEEIRIIQMLTSIDMLYKDEGVASKVYKDKYGNHTVGIGFNMDSPSARGLWIKAGISESFNSVYSGATVLSKNSATRLLGACISSTKEDILSIFPDYTTYPATIQLALTNLMFNLGRTKFSKFNTFIDLVKNKDFKAAADDLMNTAWANEVGDRADRVYALLNNDDTQYA